MTLLPGLYEIIIQDAAGANYYAECGLRQGDLVLVLASVPCAHAPESWCNAVTSRGLMDFYVWSGDVKRVEL